MCWAADPLGLLAAPASSHVALVVKGVDLRSTGRKSVWVRTPQMAKGSPAWQMLCWLCRELQDNLKNIHHSPDGQACDQPCHEAWLLSVLCCRSMELLAETAASHFARVVKGVDLRSTGCMHTWVQAREMVHCTSCPLGSVVEHVACS